MVLESILTLLWSSLPCDLVRHVCSFDLAIMWDISRMLYLYEGVCHISYRIKDKIYDTIEVEIPFNLINTFKVMITLKPKVDNIHIIRSSHYNALLLLNTNWKAPSPLLRPTLFWNPHLQPSPILKNFYTTSKHLITHRHEPHDIVTCSMNIILKAIQKINVITQLQSLELELELNC